MLILEDMDGDQGTPDTDMSIISPFISLLVSQQPIINNKHITTMVTKGIKSIIQIKVCTGVKKRTGAYGLNILCTGSVRPESSEQRRSGKLSNLGF